MRTQHNFCTQQLRYVGITMIVIFFVSKFVCRNSGQIASRRSWKRSCLGLEYTSKCSRLAPLWEPNYGEHDVQIGCGVDIVRNDMYSERCVSLVFLFWGEVGKFRSSRVVPRERVGSTKSESRRVKLLRDGCACGARVNLGMRNVHRVHVTDI